MSIESLCSALGRLTFELLLEQLKAIRELRGEASPWAEEAERSGLPVGRSFEGVRFSVGDPDLPMPDDLHENTQRGCTVKFDLAEPLDNVRRVHLPADKADELAKAILATVTYEVSRAPNPRKIDVVIRLRYGTTVEATTGIVTINYATVFIPKH
jgi:hypothetical protein